MKQLCFLTLAFCAAPVFAAGPPVPSQELIDELQTRVMNVSLWMQSTEDFNLFYTVSKELDEQGNAPLGLNNVVASSYTAYLHALDSEGDTVFTAQDEFTIGAGESVKRLLRWQIANGLHRAFTIRGLEGDFGDRPTITIYANGQTYYVYRNWEDEGWVYHAYLPWWVNSGTLTISGNGLSNSTLFSFDLLESLDGVSEVEYTEPPNTGDVSFQVLFPGEEPCFTVTEPTITGSASTTVYDVVADGGVVYAEDSFRTIRMYALPDMTYLNTLEFQNSIGSWEVKDGTLYVFYGGRLHIVDVETFTEVGSIAMSNGVIFVEGTYLYVVSMSQISSVDITDPVNPALIETESIQMTYQVAHESSRLYIPTDNFTSRGVNIYEVAGGAITWRGFIPTLLAALSADNNILCGRKATDNRSVAYDVSNPEYPVLLGEFPTTIHTWSTINRCGYYFLPDYGGTNKVHVFDINSLELTMSIPVSTVSAIDLWQDMLITKISGHTVKAIDLEP